MVAQGDEAGEAGDSDRGGLALPALGGGEPIAGLAVARIGREGLLEEADGFREVAVVVGADAVGEGHLGHGGAPLGGAGGRQGSRQKGEEQKGGAESLSSHGTPCACWRSRASWLLKRAGFQV